VGDGRADAAIGDVVANVLVFKAPYGQGLVETGAPITETRYLGIGAGIALRKGNEALRQRFDQALQAIHQSGQYGQIRSRYFTVDVWADE
jgi:arginine/ornithine transport system substrate-binding protein